MKTKIIQHPRCQLPKEETQKTLKKSPLFNNEKKNNNNNKKKNKEKK